MSTGSAGHARAVFVNSGAFYALNDPKDVNHVAARAIAARLARERWRSFTTNFVVAETHALVLRRRGRAVATRLLAEIDTGSTGAIIRQFGDKDFSLTDAISFAVMARLGIRHAFAFDRHFAQYGFTVLGPPAMA